MSRIGKKVIVIPEKTEIKQEGNVFNVKGPHGELSKKFRSDIVITVADGTVTLAPKKQNGETKALWGTYASHVFNMIQGVNVLYEKKLIMEGVGYKVDIKMASDLREAYKRKRDDFTKQSKHDQVRAISATLRRLDELEGMLMELQLGFSHPVFIKLPDNLTVTAEKNVITVKGVDTEKVGQFAAEIRAFKKPEPYKGKGIRYDTETVRRKQGKKSA